MFFFFVSVIGMAIPQPMESFTHAKLYLVNKNVCSKQSVLFVLHWTTIPTILLMVYFVPKSLSSVRTQLPLAILCIFFTKLSARPYNHMKYIVLKLLFNK